MSQEKEYLIRTLTPIDQPFLQEILYHIIFVPEGEAPPPRDVVQQPELAKYVQNFGRPGDMGYVAVDSATHAPLGAAWLRVLTGDERGYGYVDDATPELSIALLPDQRGRGIGTTLLQRLIAAARPHYHAISLSVWPQNPAYRLYQRLGFSIVAQAGPAVTMVKRLDANAHSVPSSHSL